MTSRRKREEEELISVKVLSKRFEQIAEEERANCVQCNKPGATTLDGTHVKNRKQFFEGQAQDSEKDIGNAKPKTEKKILHHTNRFQKDPKLQDGCPCNVKYKKQLFERYQNENTKKAPISKISSNLKDSMGKKRTSMIDLSYRNKHELHDNKKIARRFSHEIEKEPDLKHDQNNIYVKKDSIEDKTPPPIPDSRPPQTLLDVTDGDFYLFLPPRQRRFSPPTNITNDIPISDDAKPRSSTAHLLRKFKVQSQNDSMNSDDLLSDVFNTTEQNNNVMIYASNDSEGKNDFLNFPGDVHTTDVIGDGKIFNATEEDYVLPCKSKSSNDYDSMVTVGVIEDHKIFTTAEDVNDKWQQNAPLNSWCVNPENDSKIFDATQEGYELPWESKPTNIYDSMGIIGVLEDHKISNTVEGNDDNSEQKVPLNSMGTVELIEDKKRYYAASVETENEDEASNSSLKNGKFNGFDAKHAAQVSDCNYTFNISQEGQNSFGTHNEADDSCLHQKDDEVTRSNIPRNWCGTVVPRQDFDETKVINTMDEFYAIIEQNTPTSTCDIKDTAEISDDASGFKAANLEFQNQDVQEQNVPFHSHGTKRTDEVTEDQKILNAREELNSTDNFYESIDQNTFTKTCNIKDTAKISDNAGLQNQDRQEQNIPYDNYGTKQTVEVIEDKKILNEIQDDYEIIGEQITPTTEIVEKQLSGTPDTRRERPKPKYEGIDCTYNPSRRGEATADDIISNSAQKYTENLYEEIGTPEDNIEACISNVTKAFESIQTILNNDQPKWTIWDIAKNPELSKSSSFEDDCDIFGSLLDIETDYCVETFNTGNDNVLFRISIGREVLMKGEEDGHFGNPYNGVALRNEILYEEPEYYSIIQDSYKDERHMSGIYFDKNKIPRIEIIGQRKDIDMPHLNVPNMQYLIIKELIDSEATYLNRMKYIIDNYLIHFRRNKISSDIEMVFGNIEEIHNKTETIYKSLKTCWSIDEIALVFLANVSVFDCYTDYLRNKRKSQQYASTSFADIIKQRQIELEDQYTCDSYLLNTTHRAEQYKLILERLNKVIIKSGESCQSLTEAIALIETKMAETNTILTLDSIKYLPSSLKELGTFLMREKFNVKNKYTSMVFLFQSGVVFCVEDQEAPDTYEFIECIEMDKLLLRHRNTSTSFQLSWFDKSKKYARDNQHDFDIEAPSMAVKEKWVDEIKRILWTQLQYYKDQQMNATLKRTNHVAIANNSEEDIKDFEHESKDASESTEENEYCVINDDNYDTENMKMSGTFFDGNENPRIQIIRTESQVGDDLKLRDVPRAQYLCIRELLTTEKTYLNKMKHIIDGYYKHFKLNGASPEISIVFGNIEAIYKETQEIYLKLLDCYSIDDIARVFIDNAHIFDLYTDYLRNKSKSYHYANTKFKDLIKERQAQLEDQYTCDSYLLNPVQRPVRYKLLLEKLQREIQKAGETSQLVTEAVKLVAYKISEANTLMTIDSIHKSTVDLKKMGHFIMKDTFNIKRKYKSVIFLFRDIVVFCSEDQQRSDTYVYVDSIVMTELSLSHNRFSTTFQLRNFGKSKMGEEGKCTFDIEAPTMIVKERWIDEIQRLLWSQLQYFKDQQKRTKELGLPSPFVRKNSMRMKKKPYDSATKTSNRSTFYYDILANNINVPK